MKTTVHVVEGTKQTETVLECDQYNQAEVLKSIKKHIGRVIKAKAGVITVRDDGTLRYFIQVGTIKS